jgi:DNA polymerase-3 subunit beta
MKITIPKTDLAELLNTVSRGVSGRSTQPVQDTILVSAQDYTLRMTATDLEYIGVVGESPAEVQEPGTICAPAKVLAAIAGSLPDAPVELETDATKSEMHLRAGGASVKLHCLPTDDYQTLPEPNDPAEFTISSGELAEVLALTSFACGTDETLPVLTGVHFVLNRGHLRLEATDTYRLSVTHATSAFPSELSRKVIVPASVLREVERCLVQFTGDVTVQMSDRLVRLLAGSYAFSSRLVQGEFPKLERIIPQAFTTTVTVPRVPLQDALKRAVLVGSNNMPFRVHLHMADDDLTITSQGDHTNDSFREPLEATVSGDPLVIGINAKLLLSALEAAGTDDVRIRCNSNLDPLAVDAPGRDWLYIGMPLQDI